MTDSQAINSSVLAEYLDVLKQMQKSLQAHAVHTEYKSTQAYLARAMDTQLYSLIPNCDALRALVAEQEQADVNEEWEQERIRCGMRWGEEQEQASADISLADAQKIAQEIAGRARERREEFRASDLDTSPAFAVGDTVSGYLEGDLVERTISHFNTKYGMWVMTDGGWWEAKDLTLIRKANA